MAAGTGGALLQICQEVCAATSRLMGADFYAALLSGLWKGVFQWAAAMCVPLIIGFVLHRHRLMGAGDTKLLAVLCGIAGHKAVLPLCAFSLLIGGMLSVAVIVRFSGFKVRFRTLAANASKALHDPVFHYDPDLLRTSQSDTSPGLSGGCLRYLLKSGRIHFSVPILGAAIICAASGIW